MASRPGCGSGTASAEHLRHRGDRSRIGRRPDEEDGHAPFANERQAQLRGHRRRRERLRDRDAVGLVVLLGAAAHAPERWELGGDVLEKCGLAPVRLEQRHLPVGERRGERQTGRAPSGSDVHDRPLELTTRGAAASDCSTWTRQASSGSRIAVRPGVARRAAIQRRSRSSVTRGQNDHVPVRLDALALGLDAGLVLQAQVHDLALGRAHRLELDPLPARAHAGRNLMANSSSVARRRSR